MLDIKLTRDQLLQRPTSTKGYEKLAERLARSIQRRAYNSGLKLDYDDIKSDVWMIWVRCRDAFDPERGYQFDTYWSRAVTHNYKEIMRRNNDYILTGAKSGNLHNVTDGNGSEYLDIDVLDNISDQDALNPEEIFSRREQLDSKTLAARAPLLAAFADLIACPPPELIQELEALKAQTAHARGLGFQSERAPEALNINMLIDVFGLDWRHRKQLIREMEEVAADV